MSDCSIVIIGAGPAGVAAAVQCRRLGVPALLLDRDGRAGGLVVNAFCVENYPGLEPMDGEAFARRLRDHLARFGVTVEKGRVRRVVPSDRGFAVLGDFGEMASRAVICATGTRPVELEIPGAVEIRGKGLFYHVQELMRFLDRQKARPNRRKVFVVGGGEAALDYSLGLARAGLQVTVLVRADRFRARGRLVALVRGSPAVEVVFGAELGRVDACPDGVALEITRHNERAGQTGCAVVAAIGRKSDLEELLEGLDRDLTAGVSTRIPGLYAAGDARSGALGQAGMAAGDGLAAAMAAVAYVEAEK